MRLLHLIVESKYESRSEVAERNWVNTPSPIIIEDTPSEKKVSAKFEPPPALAPFLSRRGSNAVRRILTIHKPETPDANFIGLPPDELKLYFTLTRRAEAPQPTPPLEAARLVFEPQMVKIPPGKFLMGTTAEQAQAALKETKNDKDWQKLLEWEQPQHTVELSEYSIGKYPITNREYQEFIKDAKYQPPQGWDGDKFPDGKGGHPVVNVSWDDAIAYCKWLSEKTKKPYRLPTEAEWEKAARGEDGRVYPWGKEFDSKKANTNESGIVDTSEVGQFSPQGDSPFGCADMAGNVLEWCLDWFDGNEYRNRKQGVKDPKGPESGSSRGLRGGSWAYDQYFARVSFRYLNRPSYPWSLYGFRVVVASPPA